MFCPECGKQMADNSAFCNECGKVLNAEKQTPQAIKNKINKTLSSGPKNKFSIENYFSFRSMITRPIAKFVYVLGILGVIILCYTNYSGDGVLEFSVGEFLRNTLMMLVGQVIWRILCEMWLLFFSIHETLVDCRKSLRILVDKADMTSKTKTTTE